MESIVLARKNIRESDQIISVYTKEKGKLDLLARGVKKITSKNSAHLEPFSFVDIDIAPGKGIDYLTKVQPINYFANIRNDLQKSLSAGYIVSLLDKVLHTSEKDEKIFDLLLSWLEFINQFESISFQSKSMLDGFIVKLLNCLGYDITQVDKLDFELEKDLELLKTSDWEIISNIPACHAWQGLAGRQYPISPPAMLGKAWRAGNIQKLHSFIYNFLVERLERKVKDWGK